MNASCTRTSPIKKNILLWFILFKAHNCFIWSFTFDKPKAVTRNQKQKLTTRFSLKSQCPTTHPHIGRSQKSFQTGPQPEKSPFNFQFLIPNFQILNFPIPNFRILNFQILNFQIPNFWNPNSRIRNFQIPNVQIPKFKIPNFQIVNFPIPNFQFQIFKLQILRFRNFKSQFQISNFHFQFWF